MMGTALGGVGYAEEQFMVFMSEGIKSVSTTLATNVFGGAASCNVAIEFGVMGPNSTNAMSCASGTMAIGEGFRQIRDDYADVMICGGSRHRSTSSPLAPLDHPRDVRAQRRSVACVATIRPGARRIRDGRGAAVLVLEEYERARPAARGSMPKSWDMRLEMTRTMTAPRPDGTQAAQRCARRCVTRTSIRTRLDM